MISFNVYAVITVGEISGVLIMKSFDGNNKKIASSNIDYVPLLLLIWAITSIISWTIQSLISGQLKRLISRRGSTLNSYQNLNNQRNVRVRSVQQQQRTFSYPDTLEFNFFDPDNLPLILVPYADVVFSTVQSLAKQYGFQVDNSRNQAEHLLMMLTNEWSSSDSNLSLAAERLHIKLFKNYRKWCDRIGTTPLFCRRFNGKAYASYIEDSLVFLLIWGEASNLKHLPECLCYLYHKMMQENISNFSQGISSTTYPGYYLDMVVTPIYDVIASSLKKSGDNEYKKTYDDFNEFFWSPKCLKYKMHDNAEDVESGNISQDLNVLNDNCNESNECISLGIKEATKTYLEKRSWLHPLLSVHRVIEWHIITFTLLMAWAFSNLLVWTHAFTFQIASFIFLEITFLGIIWTCLEVIKISSCHANIPLLLTFIVNHLILTSILENFTFTCH